MMKDRILGIVGPTGSGKSAFAVDVAKRFGGEIISCDSVQIYRGFDIGSGKIKPSEMEGVPHHLLDIRSGNESFSAGDFQSIAEGLVEEIRGRGHLPILVGGTGLYYRAFAYQYQLEPKTDELDARERDIRRSLEKALLEEGSEGLYQALLQEDPSGARGVDPRHSSRVLRALVYHRVHGKSISDGHRGMSGLRKDLVGVYLEMDRGMLYDRIDQRVDSMMEEGFLEEVQGLLKVGIQGDAAPMRTIGYKEMVRVIRGEMSLEEGVLAMKQGSRNYAKRQITWFRKHEELHRLDWGREEDLKKALVFLDNLLN